MPVDAYYKKRVVSWVAHYLAKEMDLAAIIQQGAKRQPPFSEAIIRECFPDAEQAVENADLINFAPDECRLCDIPGFRLPKDEGKQ